MPKINVRIIHETNPSKYYPAIFLLADNGLINVVGAHRYSVVKEWFRSLLRDRKPFLKRSKDALKDAMLRLKLPFIKDEIIIFGFAPWDWRIFIYGILVFNNRIIYHTSWPYWEIKKTPNQYGILNHWFEKVWLLFLEHPNVEIVAVTNTVSSAVSKFADKRSHIITHSVPSVFFEARKKPKNKSDDPLKIIYVGELSVKKGVNKFLDIAKKINEERYIFTIVGDGPLREKCSQADKAISNVYYKGPIYDKNKLSDLMSMHDIFLLLSQRTDDWEELFGIVIIEALATGLGVITTAHIGPLEIFSEIDCKNIFRETAKDEIVNRLEELAENPKELEKFKTKQLEIAKQYHINAVSQQWYSLLNKG